jgi:hypothetical protein
MGTITPVPFAWFAGARSGSPGNAFLPLVETHSYSDRLYIIPAALTSKFGKNGLRGQFSVQRLGKSYNWTFV